MGAMDYFGWLWVVALCSWLVGTYAMNGMGRKVLNELERVSPIMLKMSLWEVFVCVWAVLAIFSILAISMARSKNTVKGKATSSSMERVVKKERSIRRKLWKRVKGSEKSNHRKARKKVKSNMKTLRLCLLNPWNPSEKSGSSQLKDDVSTMSGE